MTSRTIVSAFSLLLSAALPQAALAQSVGTGQESSQAILDTGVLFAIGAREAEQQIRGSFGWPTFQEGFVEGVYFRFDPDGYARFSTSPRLDEDVFEVICTPGSPVCSAKKDIIEVGLTNEGKVQVRFAGITPADTFYVSDKKTELPLPPTILEPLDARLETLLSSGGELIIKREQEVLQNLSLSGFSAVATYLRWVAQGQSPRVFPRGWPVPAQTDQQVSNGLTQPNQWDSPNPGPQVVSTTWQAQQVQPRQAQTQLQPQQQQGFGQPVPAPTNFGQPLPPQQQGWQNWQATQQVAQPGQNYTGTAPAANPAMTQMQQTIQTLQAELATLQARNAATPQNDPAVENNGALFAEQAQGRSLPTPAGFPNQNTYPSTESGLTAQQQSFGAVNQTGQTAGQQAVAGASGFGVGQSNQSVQFPSAQHRNQHSTSDINPHQLQRIETELMAMRSEMLTILNQIYQSVAHANGQQMTGHNAGSMVHDQGSGNRDFMGQTPQASLAQPMSQTGQQGQQAVNTTAGQQPMSPNGPSSQVTLERDLVEELLRNLDGETAATTAPAAAPAVADAEAPSEGTQAAAQPAQPETAAAPATPQADAGTEDFISLSDYLSKILKSEGLDAQGGTQ